jgi:hypothetical protein
MQKLAPSFAKMVGFFFDLPLWRVVVALRVAILHRAPCAIFLRAE